MHDEANPMQDARPEDNGSDSQTPPIGDAADQGGGSGAETGHGGAPESADPLAEVTRERDELKDRLLRAVADYQNLARRSQQSVEAARAEATADLARRFITVLDTIERALELDPEKTSAQAVLDGIRSVRDEVMRVLNQAGVERIEVAPGDEFDPNRHEALMRQPAEGIESGHIVTQLQPGYTLESRTVRAAKVAIAE